MPPVSMLLIRISLVHFIVAVTVGAVVMLERAFGLFPQFWLLLPIHIELAMTGWLLPLVIGTAWWIFPRHLAGKPRGSEKAAKTATVLLVAGIWTGISGAVSTTPEAVFAGRIVLLTAVLLFAVLLVPRVVSYRDRP